MGAFDTVCPPPLSASGADGGQLPPGSAAYGSYLERGIISLLVWSAQVNTKLGDFFVVNSGMFIGHSVSLRARW